MSSAATRLAAAGGILMMMDSLSQRGGERVAILLANGLARARIPVRIVLKRNSGEAEAELRAMLHKDVSIAAAGAPLRLPGSKIFERARAIPFLRRQIRDFAPAIVLCTINSLALTTALARQSTTAGPKFALKLTNPILPTNMVGPRRFFRRKVFQFAFSRFDLALTLSEADRRRALEVYPGRDNLFRAVANAYVTSAMLSGPTPAQHFKSPRILASGALTRRKRFDLLLRALARSQDRTSKLTILGDGPLRADLHRLAESLGIADRVNMPGFTQDVVPWLREADLFVLPSDYEGLPAVVLEALACGVRVVSTDSFASARELLEPLDGCEIAPPGDAGQLAKAIDRSLSSDADPMALRCVAHDYLIESSLRAHIAELGRIARGTEAVSGSVTKRATAANDDAPSVGGTAGVLRRVALMFGIFAAGWLMHDVAGPITSSAHASTFVDDAVGAYRANLISDAMETRREIVRYDRAEVASTTGVRMPRLPTQWRVLDVQVFTHPQGVNLAVELPDGSRVSVFGMKTQGLSQGHAIAVNRNGDSVVYWDEGTFAFAVVGKVPSKTLMKSAASLDPDGPAISA